MNREEITILHLSDLHNYHPKGLPEADLLIISGDYGFKSRNAPLDVLIKEFKGFNHYLRQIKHKYDQIIFSAGNHDTLFELNEEIARKTLSNATVLLHESMMYKGYKIFASPYTPTFFNWAFNVDSGIPMQEKWRDIPSDTDILVTHCPPCGILDQGNSSYKNLGCKDLREAIKSVRSIVHLMGHIHEGNGFNYERGTLFVNSSIMDEYYIPNGHYHLLTIEENGVTIQPERKI